MIYEIRTYRIAPRSLAEVEKRFGDAYEYRKKYSPLTAFWHTEIGPLNEIIHVWAYPDLAERARVRAEAAKDPNWPPKISEFVQTMRSEIVVPVYDREGGLIAVLDVDSDRGGAFDADDAAALEALVRDVFAGRG